ncbi:MAG: radical SAM protein [Lachnospiraceae bacterium]
MVQINERKVNSYVSKTKIPTSDYVINPYVGCPHKCMYCYAEFMKRFTGHDEDWGDFLDVKRCDKPINTQKLIGTTVTIGTVTDPYNPFERKYEITQSILKQLAGSTVRFDLITKSCLVTRDIELLQQIPNLKVVLSFSSLDDNFRKRMEPFASSVQDKIAALQELHQAGIDTCVFMSPMFPGITDFKKIIEATRDLANEYWFENLNLRAGYYTRVMSFIKEYYPQLTSLYDEIYRKKNMSYWELLSNEIDDFCTSTGCTYHNYFYHEKIKKK